MSENLKASLQERLDAIGQAHLLTFWDRLSEAERAMLRSDVESLPVEQIGGLVRDVVQADARPAEAASLEPPACYPAEPPSELAKIYSDARARGESLIAQGRVAALTVAGGQGTRLGFDGPKGAFPVSPVARKPLFQLFAEMILFASRRAGRAIRWYVMTSQSNDAETRSYFAAHKDFGLDARQVRFFSQGMMPAFSKGGRILLSERHRVALSPDGHGGTLTALRRSGALAEMAAAGVEHVSYFQVDNPLVKPLDPLFIGLHATTGSEMSSKAVRKTDPSEKVGVFAMAGGALRVIEYSDLPAKDAEARRPDGSLRLDAGSIAIHVIARALIERVTDASSKVSLPWHRAEKKVPFVDLASGRPVEPTAPNAVKLERFIFDAVPLAAGPIVLMTERAEEFSPVKNADGPDSPATARRDMVRAAARRVEACGVRVPRRLDGEPDCVIEISPLVGDDLPAALARAGIAGSLPRGGEIYIS